MNFYFKNIRRLIRFCFINFLILFGFNVVASECGVFQLQNNRSSGISVKANKCSELPYISKGTVFDLAARGRLWLKSNSTELEGQGFQMICQNRTGQVIQLEFSDPLSPWLSLAKLKNCQGWTNNKLSCDGNNAEKKGVNCVFTFLKPALNNSAEQIQRTSSVKMRDLNQLVTSVTHFDKPQLLESLKPELTLCKQVNEITQDIRVNWVVQMTKVKMFELMSPKVQQNDALSGCIEAVIKTTTYPMFSRKESFDSVF